MELVFKTEDNQPSYAKASEGRKAEIVFFPVLKNQEIIQKLIISLGYEDEKSILSRLNKEKFSGAKDQTFVIHGDQQVVVLLGSGQEKKLSLENWRQLSGTMIFYLKKYKASKIGLEIKLSHPASRNDSLLLELKKCR